MQARSHIGVLTGCDRGSRRHRIVDNRGARVACQPVVFGLGPTQHTSRRRRRWSRSGQAGSQGGHTWHWCTPRANRGTCVCRVVAGDRRPVICRQPDIAFLTYRRWVTPRVIGEQGACGQRSVVNIDLGCWRYEPWVVTVGIARGGCRVLICLLYTSPSPRDS